jgi:acetyl-CoA carboxylase carboxyl transferase subunit alpha
MPGSSGLERVMSERRLQFLAFEQPIAEEEAKREELLASSEEGEAKTRALAEIDERIQKLTQAIYADLDPWRIAQVSRHPQRPYTLDYIERIMTDFEPLAGDRTTADDPAIVGGLARFRGRPLVVLGHQKGRETKEKIARNFGMPKPEGYRKALRLMQLAERFRLPVVTFIDTPGAYPGVEAEERNQSEAIARNLAVMSQLAVPIVAFVIGEGGSGGALAIGVADRVLMLQYGIYSVISPEGCASILWKSAEYAPTAAAALGLTAARLRELGLVDRVLEEPLGGAHRNPDEMARRVADALAEELEALSVLPAPRLVEERYQKIMRYGVYTSG